MGVRKLVTCDQAVSRIADLQIGFALKSHQIETLILIFGEQEVKESLEYYKKNKQIG